MPGSNTLNSDDFTKTEQLFVKWSFAPLYEQIRLRLLVLKDKFESEEEFNKIIEEVLLISSQENKALNPNSFFILCEKVQEDLRRDEEIEFNHER